MMVDLARRAIVGMLLTVATLALFVLAVALAWPGAAIFWTLVLFLVMALSVGRRPVRAIRAWRYVSSTTWRYYDAQPSVGSAGERIELHAPHDGETLYMRVFADKRGEELLKWSAAYGRVWFAGRDTGRGLVVPAGGGVPVLVRRVVPLPGTR